jgi:hypothetical protein
MMPAIKAAANVGERTIFTQPISSIRNAIIFMIVQIYTNKTHSTHRIPV